MKAIDMGAAVKALSAHRIIGSYSQGQPGPLVVAMGGIHGNEPSGVLAIDSVIRQLQEYNLRLNGSITGLVGNQRALAENRRCIDEDLNRCFLPEKVQALYSRQPYTMEEGELKDITDSIDTLADGFDRVVFIDCHTTSSETVPYISVNAHSDSLHLTKSFPMYSVIGLEQSIPGCFGEYFNNLDYQGFTVEAGQHNEFASIENHESIIWLLLACCGAMNKQDIADYGHHHQSLARYIVEGKKHFRLIAHYKISAGEEFVMCPGYVNFSRVSKDQVLAVNRYGYITACQDSRILMPLYQKEGDDGFFLLEEE